MKAHGSALLPFVAVLAIISVGACALAPAARPTATVSARATPTVTLAPPASVWPAATTPRTTPTSEETAGPTPSSTPPEDGDGPPQGLLRSGNEEVAGYPGSYCFKSMCADIGGWPPKSSLPRVNAGGDRLDFSIAHDLPFVSWSAAYNDKPNDDRSTPLGDGGTPYDPDAIGSPPPQFLSASIPRPPAGDWVVWIWVDLESGDLSYAWHVIVD